MEKTSEFLIYLMACSLQGTKPEEALLANIDMEALLRLAKAHSVSAMVCMALEQTDAFQHAAETTRLKWLDCKNKAVRKNMLLDAERHRLEKEFAEHGIWYMPLKGSILKDWYPKFGMREMADNDILFDATRRQQVRDIFVNRGYSIESYNKSSNHDAYEKQPIYNFEMHVALFHEDCSTLQKKYENVVDRLVQDEKLPFRYHFTPEDFYVFVVAHAYKHYFSHQRHCDFQSAIPSECGSHVLHYSSFSRPPFSGLNFTFSFIRFQLMDFSELFLNFIFFTCIFTHFPV